MGDDSNIKDTIEVVKGLVEAVPIYQDALQPAVKEIGKSLETLAKTINLALAPIAGLVWGYEKIRDYLCQALIERFKEKPLERIVTPNPRIAGPIIEALRFAAQEPTLRELYANLLATSMDSLKNKEAHPSFVEIIKQITPDEAKIIKLFREYSFFAVVTIRIYDFKYSDKVNDSPLYKLKLLKSDYIEAPIYLSLIGYDSKCEYSGLTPYYINNLCRLGLTEIIPGRQINDANLYEKLENHPDIQELKKYDEEQYPDKTVMFNRGLLQVTPFGKQFCISCTI